MENYNSSHLARHVFVMFLLTFFDNCRVTPTKSTMRSLITPLVIIFSHFLCKNLQTHGENGPTNKSLKLKTLSFPPCWPVELITRRQSREFSCIFGSNRRLVAGNLKCSISTMIMYFFVMEPLPYAMCNLPSKFVFVTVKT